MFVKESSQPDLTLLKIPGTSNNRNRCRKIKREEMREKENKKMEKQREIKGCDAVCMRPVIESRTLWEGTSNHQIPERLLEDRLIAALNLPPFLSFPCAVCITPLLFILDTTFTCVSMSFEKLVVAV